MAFILASGGEIAPSTVNISITVNGALEDSITIYDSNENLLGTCIFEVNKTYGTFSTIVSSGYSDTWKFVSRVAKATDGSGNDYSKYITVSDSPIQTVKVFPTDSSNYPTVFPWYGNDYGYFAIVPTMTSNTTPYGTLYCNHEYTSDGGAYLTYKAFDKNNNTRMSSDTFDEPVYIQYHATTSQKLRACTVYPDYTDGLRAKTVKIQGSNDGVTFTDLATKVLDNVAGTQGFAFYNDTSYEYCRLLVIDKYASSSVSFWEIQFYAAS